MLKELEKKLRDQHGHVDRGSALGTPSPSLRPDQSRKYPGWTLCRLVATGPLCPETTARAGTLLPEFRAERFDEWLAGKAKTRNRIHTRAACLASVDPRPHRHQPDHEPTISTSPRSANAAVWANVYSTLRLKSCPPLVEELNEGAGGMKEDHHEEKTPWQRVPIFFRNFARNVVSALECAWPVVRQLLS